MADSFKLPSSSYEEIIKIIQAYASQKEGAVVSIDEISQATGIPRTVVSSNNGFLVQVGIITEGNKKSATDIGRNLGRASISKLDYEIDRIWKEIIADNDFLSRMISAVRIRGGMDRSNFLNHIIYSSGQKDTKQNRTGASAIIELLKSINVLEETDGKLTVSESLDHIPQNTSSSQEPIESQVKEERVNSVSITKPCSKASVIININVDCTVDELDELSKKLKTIISDLS